MMLASGLLNAGELDDAKSAFTQKDPKAVQLFLPIASKGNADAQFYLGFIFDEGLPSLRIGNSISGSARLGVAIDYVEASKWYKLSADQGHAEAAGNLAQLYYEGRGVQKNLQVAQNLLRQGAEKGDPGSQWNLGVAYFKGDFQKDYAQALYWFKALIDNNRISLARNHEPLMSNKASALGFIGLIYENGGFGVVKNIAEAVQWYGLSAGVGDHFSQYRLGLLYLDGGGTAVRQDFKRALTLFELSAKQGYSPAQTAIGDSYYFGDGVKQDLAQAAYWYQLAADQGEVIAQTALGVMYVKGEGVTRDYAKALQLLVQAANKDDAVAINTIGAIYERGLGVQQDYAQAFRHYQLAANQGDDNAQNNIGNMFEYGRGVKQDRIEAVRWYKLSAAKGNKSAQENILRLQRN